jgi:hypothetical protein
MLQVLNGSTAAVKSPRLIIGTVLQRRLPTLSPTFLAVLGFEMQSGLVAVTCTSPKQTKALTDTPFAHLRTVAGATPLELTAMKRRGYTVEQLHQEQLANRQMNDSEVDAVIEHVGVSRMLYRIEHVMGLSVGTLIPNGDNTQTLDNGGLAQL